MHGLALTFRLSLSFLNFQKRIKMWENHLFVKNCPVMCLLSVRLITFRQYYKYKDLSLITISYNAKQNKKKNIFDILMKK